MLVKKLLTYTQQIIQRKPTPKFPSTIDQSLYPQTHITYHSTTN